MPERLRTSPAWPSAGLRRTGFSVLAAAVAWLATGEAATAAEPDRTPAPAVVPPSCLDERVDVYLSPLLREEGPPIRTFLKPGPPPVHLRLPRRRLRVDLMPSIYANTEDCGQKAFSGWRAIYQRTSDLAYGLGIPYDQPKVQDHRFEFWALDPDARPPSARALSPVNDSADRDGMARKGAWTVDLNYTGPNLHVLFCLVPPAPEGLCYARTERGMGYDTGNVSIYAQAFSTATFGPPPNRLYSQITVADLDHYFAFLRRIADAVVVAPTSPAP